jgi:quinohemoprotein ethanol dehydrogenase
MNSKTLASLILVFWIPLCVSEEARVVDDKAIADETNTSEWLAYGRTHSEQRFSPLTDINTNNITDLQVDWFLDLPKDSGLVATPLVVDGILYFVGQVNVIRAVNAVTGKLLWEYDPESGKAIGTHPKVGWFHNRGLSYYKGKIFAGTWDGRLIAVDALTGRLIWSARTFELDEPLYITGAPKAFKDKVIIGNGGTEHGPSRGFVTAYDADTGEEAWKFYIVPGNPADGFENTAMEMAAKTWTGEWWKHGGGGNPWHAITYDAELETLYIGTGNGSPWNRKIRSPEGGDNLFLSSIVALDPDTGEYKWHYQTTPGESWDFNSNMDIILADLSIDGEEIKAILHAPKNGFFYVINRANGKLISAKPFVKTTWASHIDLDSGRPVEIAGARYESGSARVSPTPAGGHNWHAMSYNPITGLAYIPSIHLSVNYSDAGIDTKTWRSVPFQGGMGVNSGGYGTESGKAYPASLQAWDPIRQELAWAVPQSSYWNAGTLTTAGNLVFQGHANGHFMVYDARTGKALLDRDLGLGISAPPITYKIDDRQYVALLVGFGGSVAGLGGAGKLGWSYGIHTRRVIAFSLEGKTILPKQPAPFFPIPIDPPEFEIDAKLARAGSQLYQLCGYCHGGGAAAAGMAPDLRASPIPLVDALFADVVRDGSRIGRGMPAFSNFTDQHLKALQHYFRSRVRSSKPAEGGIR